MSTLDEEMAGLAILADTTGTVVPPANPLTPPQEGEGDSPDDLDDEEDKGSSNTPPPSLPVNTPASNEEEEDEINAFLTELEIEVPDGTEVSGATDVLNLVKAKMQVLEGKVKDYQAIPYVDDLVKWVNSGKALEDFNQRPVRYDYSKIELEGDTDDKIDLQEQVVRTLMLKQDKDAEDIEDTIELYKTKGILESKSKAALAKIDELNKQEVDAYNKEIDKEEKARAKEQDEENKRAEEALKEAEAIITKGKIKGLVLPSQDRLDFVKFIKPNGNKPPQVLAAREALTTEECLAIDYLIMNKFNFSKLISGLTNKVVPEAPKRTGGLLFTAKNSTDSSKPELSMADLSSMEAEMRKQQLRR